jgi:hypothetical protein
MVQYFGNFASIHGLTSRSVNNSSANSSVRLPITKPKRAYCSARTYPLYLRHMVAIEAETESLSDSYASYSDFQQPETFSNGYNANTERRFSIGGSDDGSKKVWIISGKSVRQIRLVDGRETYTVDGCVIPRIPIGEAGRHELKATLAGSLPRGSAARKEANRFALLKSASVDQLLVMAMSLGLWDKAERISAWHREQRDPNKPLQVY